MFHLTTALDAASAVPLYEQLYESLAEEMRTGAIPAGTRMPGKRRLAAELSVSVNTVDAAYQLLAAEGYLESRERSGFYVQEYLALPIRPAAPPPAALLPQPEAGPPVQPVRYDLSTRGVDPALFPFRTWARLQKELLYSSPELLTHGDAQGDIELRQALAGVARDAAEVPSTELFAAADNLIPAGLNVDGMNYRDTVGDVSPAAVDVKALYLAARQGMANSDFNKITLMLPAGCGLNEAAETINGAWQKELSLFFSIEEVDEETFRKRLAEGDYTIALAPVSAESGSVYNTLAQFTPTGGGLTGYSNALYATQLEASTHANGSTRCRLLGECERQLLSDCVVVPLFSQQKRLLIASGVKNLIFDPFGPVLDLTYATKE